MQFWIKKLKYRVIIFSGALAALIFFALFVHFSFGPKSQISGISTTAAVPTTTTTTTIVTTTTTTLKDSARIIVPYTVQAPFANWAVHEESCEEAALLMYHYFLEGVVTFDGKNTIPPVTAGEEMTRMKNWQVANYGREPDLTIEALGKFANSYYGYSSQVYKNITKEDVRREISNGHPILVPVMTHSLANPHYGPKSVYHILLLKGYDSLGVISNDAGIREGENYFYSWDILFSAIDAQIPKLGQGRDMLVLTR